VPAARASGERLVLTIGDSNTLGWIGEDVHWPRFLGEALRSRGLAVRVANGGVWGHSSFQGRARLDELLRLEPDVVTISFGANDAHRAIVPDAEYVARRARAELALHRLGIGQVVLAALDRFDGGGGEPEALVARVGLEAYRDNLRAMCAAARAAGARCVLLTRCFVGEPPHPLWWKAFAPRYVEATREVAAELGVPLVDLHAEFAGRPEWFQDESHFTEAGHRRAAAIVAARIADVLDAAVGPGPVAPGSADRVMPSSP
jgi:lysophospholipase L1-like esterase